MTELLELPRQMAAARFVVALEHFQAQLELTLKAVKAAGPALAAANHGGIHQQFLPTRGRGWNPSVICPHSGQAWRLAARNSKNLVVGSDPVPALFRAGRWRL